MQEEKLSEGSGLDQGACLELYAIYKLLECFQEAHFADAAILRQRVLVLTALPGGTGWLADVFTVLGDAIKTKARTCIEQHLTALVEMLDESIAEAQNPEAQPLPLEEPPPLPDLCSPNSYAYAGSQL